MGYVPSGARSLCGFLLATALIGACSGARNPGLGPRGGTPPAVRVYASRIESSWSPPAALSSLYTAARAGGTQAGRSLVPDSTLGVVAEAIAERTAANAEHRA